MPFLAGGLHLGASAWPLSGQKASLTVAGPHTRPCPILSSAPSRAFPQDLSCRAAPPSTERWGSVDGMPVSPLPLPVSLRSRSEEMRVITFALLRINPGEREENYYAQ